MPASAAPKRITGKLSQPGYTVIALAATGEASSVEVRRRAFRLRPPHRSVTLHLRARNGRYAGPVVVGRRKNGRVAILGVRAGARLGAVGVRRGFARLAKRLPKQRIEGKRRARASKGIPIGARRFGRVRSRPSRTAPRGDRDRDGIPNPIDIDDDGDLILDDIDADAGGGASGVVAQDAGLSFNPIAGLFLGATGPTDTADTAIVNANAPGLSDEQIQSGLRARGTLLIGGIPFDSKELDCGGLVYCSAGGTGKRDRGGNPGPLDPNPEPFPACCDPDADGRGSFEGDLLLQTGAGADAIRGGDMLLVGATASGEQVTLVGTLATVFATVPAIAHYVDELGTRHDVAYPVEPGTQLPVADGPDADSDVSVRFTFWRPQRRPIADELPPGTGEWIDIGRLPHFAMVPGAEPMSYCPQSSYSEIDDQLAPSPGFPSNPNLDFFVLMDEADDQPADAANTFSYTLNVSECQRFRDRGTFGPGERARINFAAALPPEPHQAVNNVQSLYVFRHEP